MKNNQTSTARLKITLQKKLDVLSIEDQWLVVVKIKIVSFILIWLMLAAIFYFLNPVNKRDVSSGGVMSYFAICVMENGHAKTININDRNDLPLCHQAHERIEEFEFGYNQLRLITLNKKIDNEFGVNSNIANITHIGEHDTSKITEWELVEHSDAMSSPLVSRYQVASDKIIPLWSSSGGFMHTVMNHFFAFVVAIFLWLLFCAFIPDIKIAIKNKTP